MSGPTKCRKVGRKRERIFPSARIPELWPPMEKVDSAIEAFWKWFVEKEEWIREVIDGDEHPDVEVLTHFLDNHLLGLGRFKWQIGPGDKGTHFLTLSPNGDEELLGLSKRIIFEAPVLNHWVFLPAIPAQPDQMTFVLYDEFGNEREIDTSNWIFVEEPIPGGKISLMLHPSNPGELDAETLRIAGEMSVSALLGEEKRIKKIGEIQILPTLDALQKSQAQNLVALPLVIL